MVKGTSRQVIVVHSPDPKIYEQAIFILRDDAKDFTNEMLLKEAMQAAKTGKSKLTAPVWIVCGAGLTALIWLLTVLL